MPFVLILTSATTRTVDPFAVIYLGLTVFTRPALDTYTLKAIYLECAHNSFNQPFVKYDVLCLHTSQLGIDV